jgi:hypothetical protein
MKVLLRVRMKLSIVWYVVVDKPMEVLLAGVYWERDLDQGGLPR